ncbi:hypothetical protein ACFOWA_13240 [Pedobacter lithocola]|uniref:Uncharacterized protein n=1 Tax=Pedobacter lithocola TaxID=1908239 RepID=A0ABV8PDH3_9SPHI
MQIAYLNKGKAAKQSENEKLLSAFRDRDIRLALNKHKDKIEALNISEPEFILELKNRLQK